MASQGERSLHPAGPWSVWRDGRGEKSSLEGEMRRGEMLRFVESVPLFSLSSLVGVIGAKVRTSDGWSVRNRANASLVLRGCSFSFALFSIFVKIDTVHGVPVFVKT